MKATDLSVVLGLLSVLVEVNPQGRAFVRFLGRDLRNHSYVDFNLVGGANEAVECRTDLRTCCSDSHTGDWYFPDGEKLPRDPDISDIFAARRFRNVQVRRKNFVNTTGIYRCEIETSVANNDSRETVYAGLYSIGGDVTIADTVQLTVDSDLNGESPQFTLTCISTGGPVTTAIWTRDTERVFESMTVLDKTITAQYTHTLTVIGVYPGHYECIVSNNKPSTATGNFTVQAASAPTNLMAVQEGPSGIRVSWSPPSPQGHTSGYRILYSGGSSGSVDVSDGSTDNHLLIDLLKGTSYTISIVGTSEHFFSDQVDYPNSIQLILVPGMPTAAVSVRTATMIFCFWSAPSGSIVQSYKVMWQRDKSRRCPEEDIGSTIITDGSTSYAITGLEEDSSYTITVTATNVAGRAVSEPVTGKTREAAPSAPPTSVGISDVTSSSITVQWGPVDCIHHNGDITGYTVRYGVQGSVSIERKNVSGSDSTEITLTGLANTTTYYIEVAAENSAGIGKYSNPITVITKGINSHEGNTGGVGIGAAVGGVIATFFVVAVIAVLWCCRKRLKRLFSSICHEFPSTRKHTNVSINIYESAYGEESQPHVTVMNEFCATSMEQLPASKRKRVSKLIVETHSTKQEPATLKRIAVANLDTHVDSEHIT